MNKQKPVSDLMKTLIGFSLNVAENQISKRVDDPTINAGVEKVFPLLREIVSELNDDNPNNAEQIKETIMAWTNGPLADYLDSVLTELSNKLDDENEKELVIYLGTLAISILRIITDLNDDNVAQIKSLWASEEFKGEAKDVLVTNLLNPLLVKKNVSPEIQNLVVTIINTLFESLFIK
jgi:hypothetical protein